MKIQYHMSSLQDAPDMFNLFQQLKQEQQEVSFTDARNTEDVITWMNTEGNYFYVARTNQQVIGALRATRGMCEQQHACHVTIAVSSDYRQQGIAKSLVLFGLSDLKTAGVKIARALIFSDNKASLNTLMAAGFSISGSVVKHHYHHQRNTYIDDIILFKEL
ncbi:GNAT family N-acetyltransferase [Anoxynatronum sibiricum]|uniref:GNAT family N-acetyltransferase n=1 Tax=Anoxynatronum sibiricum TaxID=210623 RepID=A0ABU9VV02_9CLOT